MRDVVAKTSWENTAARMRDLIESTTPGRKFTRLTAPDMSYGEAPHNAPNVNPLRTTATSTKVGSLIGGPAAYQVAPAVAAGAGAQPAVKAE
jgi:hypothetical protein